MNFNRWYFSSDNTTWVHYCNAIRKAYGYLSSEYTKIITFENNFNSICFPKVIASIAETIMNLRHHKGPNIHVWFLSKYKLYVLMLKIWLPEPKTIIE